LFSPVGTDRPRSFRTRTAPHPARKPPEFTAAGDEAPIRSRPEEVVEVQLACWVLNTMTRLGMPDSYRVEWLFHGGRPIWAQVGAMQRRPRAGSR
jgi:hypothetical protein